MQTSLVCARKLFRAIDTPRSLTCEILVRYGEWDQLATLQLDPHRYLDARAYYLDAIVTEFLRKHRQLPTSFDKAQVAFEKFLESERLCCQSNARFANISDNFFNEVGDVALGHFVHDVKRAISGVLRNLPDEVYPRFGPGATFDDRGQLTTVADKMLSVPTVSSGALGFLDLWKHTSWGREYLRRPEKRGLFKVENSGRFVTVPKDSKTDRSIDIQPSINVFYQLGIGGAIRQRLRRWGIDLDSGQEIHRRVACESSTSGLMSSIDLSSASDTISKEVVKALLPCEWYSVLESLRTPFTTVKGRRWRLEKFSAMGNGYTFELETLIFSSICKVVMDRLGLRAIPGLDFHVYGDDILVPTAANSAVLSALRYFGFVPNPKKTFSTGSFRESCGGDFFDGQPVRAYYLKEEPNEPHEIIALANGLRRLFERLMPYDRVRRRLVALWWMVQDHLPSDVRRLRGPKSLGDLVLHDRTGWSIRMVARDRGEIRVWQPIPLILPLHHWPSWVQYAGALYGVDSQGISPRGGTSGYRRAWVSLLERPT